MTTARADQHFTAIVGHLTTEADAVTRALYAFGSAMLADNDPAEVPQT